MTETRDLVQWPSPRPLSRRRILGLTLGAAIASLLNPGTGRSGRFTLVKDASAWVQVAMLAIQAYSMFANKGGDGGLSAYLQNIKSLSEENIRLTQQVLQGIGEIQASLATLPERLRKIFIEVESYKIAEGTQIVVDSLTQLEEELHRSGHLSADNRIACKTIIDRCGQMAGARANPAGRGGTAATCIALIGAVDARAHFHLKQSDSFKSRIKIFYLPWFDAILSDSDGSLQRAFLESGTELITSGTTVLDGLPDDVKAALSPAWKGAITSEPGSFHQEVTLACGSYGRHTSDQTGGCIESDCLVVADNQPLVPANAPNSQSLNRILKALQLTPQEMRTLRGSGWDPHIPEHCVCTKHAVIPVYTTGVEAGLRGKVDTEIVDGIPIIKFNTEWIGQAPASCSRFAQGDAPDSAGELGAIQNSPLGAELSKKISNFETGRLAAYNDQRAIVYTTYLLLDATKAARNQFQRVGT